MVSDYKPQDEMSLWWLGQPMGALQSPCLIGQLILAEGNRKVGLQYAPDWISNGFALSADLPLSRGVFLPKAKDEAAGAVDDARPDRWGERVIRNLFKPARLSVMEFLYFAGDDRFGALGVSLSADRYSPGEDGALPTLENLADMQRAITAVLAGERVAEPLVRLVRPGPSFGGARPKSLIKMDGEQWVVKFSEGEEFDTELIEHATMRLAQTCGIQVAQTRVLALPKAHAVAVKRFDRSNELRSHVISANTVIRANAMPMGYPELAQSLRRIARPESIRTHQLELFRRMVFNILMDNTDDHEKNHAFVRASDGYYDLSPAYDVVPSVQGLGQQQLRVGKHGAESSIENALSEIAAFGLKKDAAVEVVRRTCKVVDGWKRHFGDFNVNERDLEQLAQYIDGSWLKAQRRDFCR